MITKEQALASPHGTVFVDSRTGKRWRKTGKTKVWIRQPDKFEFPVKHGLYAHGIITSEAAEYFFTEEEWEGKK